MALALGVRRGTVIQIGADQLKVLAISGLDVKVEFSPEGGKEVLLSEVERQEVFPQVFVSTARSKNKDGLVRLVIEAPRQIKITRGPEHAAIGQ